MPAGRSLVYSNASNAARSSVSLRGAGLQSSVKCYKSHAVEASKAPKIVAIQATQCALGSPGFSVASGETTSKLLPTPNRAPELIVTLTGCIHIRGS